MNNIVDQDSHAKDFWIVLQGEANNQAITRYFNVRRGDIHSGLDLASQQIWSGYVQKFRLVSHFDGFDEQIRSIGVLEAFCLIHWNERQSKTMKTGELLQKISV